MTDLTENSNPKSIKARQLASTVQAAVQRVLGTKDIGGTQLVMGLIMSPDAFKSLPGETPDHHDIAKRITEDLTSSLVDVKVKPLVVDGNGGTTVGFTMDKLNTQ